MTEPISCDPNELLSFREWFEQLPEDLRAKATRNCNTLNRFKDTDSYPGVPSLPRALVSAFPWDASPEGADFWISVMEKLVNPQ